MDTDPDLPTTRVCDYCTVPVITEDYNCVDVPIKQHTYGGIIVLKFSWKQTCETYISSLGPRVPTPCLLRTVHGSNEDVCNQHSSFTDRQSSQIIYCLMCGVKFCVCYCFLRCGLLLLS